MSHFDADLNAHSLRDKLFSRLSETQKQEALKRCKIQQKDVARPASSKNIVQSQRQEHGPLISSKNSSSPAPCYEQPHNQVRTPQAWSSNECLKTQLTTPPTAEYRNKEACKTSPLTPATSKSDAKPKTRETGVGDRIASIRLTTKTFDPITILPCTKKLKHAASHKRVLRKSLEMKQDRLVCFAKPGEKTKNDYEKLNKSNCSPEIPRELQELLHRERTDNAGKRYLLANGRKSISTLREEKDGLVGKLKGVERIRTNVINSVKVDRNRRHLNDGATNCSGKTKK